MSSLEDRQHTLPALPPSFSAGGHEIQDYYTNSSAPRPSPNQSPYLTPYLGLRARLSQVWVNQWTILLLLVLVRIVLALSGTDDMIQDAKTQALSACTSIEKVGSAMASVPHYASQGFNEMTALSVEKAVIGLQSMVGLMLTGVEEIIVFYIGMLTNTYLCLITFAVGGSLHAVVDVLVGAQNQIQTSLTSVGDDIGNAADKVQQGLQSLANGINTVFGSNGGTKIDFSPEINKLRNFKMPSGLDDDLQKLNRSIPTFNDVKNMTDNVIRLPFEQVRKLIKGTWSNYTFDRAILPVPQKESLTFCENNEQINNFFGHLREIISNSKKAFIGVLVALAITACILAAFMEIRRYRVQQQRSKLVLKTSVDPMDSIYLLSRPHSSDLGRWCAQQFSGTKSQILVRWFVAYFTSLPALFLISLAIAGLFSCFCQYMFLHVLQREVPKLTAEVAGFTGEIVTKLNNASASWATQTNAVIIKEGADLNKDLFTWVNVSTTAVNNTLNTFVDETMRVLNSTFGGTPLADPIKEVFNCLVGLKIAGIQKGLGWVHDHANINFPLLPNDTLTGGALLGRTSPETQDFFADPKSATQDDVSAALAKVSRKLEKGIRQETIISSMLLVAWLIVVLSGLAVVLIQHNSRSKLRGEAGHEYAQQAYGTRRMSMHRPMEPAPAYTKTSQDVGSLAHYSINRHAFSQTNLPHDFAERNVSEDEINSTVPNINYHNQKLTCNEKNGPLS